MYNSFHTAQPPLRGEAAGLKTPAASHQPLPYLGYVPWVKFKLFVHHSFIIVHHAKERCPGEVPGGPRGRVQIARGPSEKPIPGQKWHGIHRRSSFTKRSVFTIVCLLCKSYVLTSGMYTWSEIFKRAAFVFDYFGSAVVQHPASGHTHML